MFQWWTDRHCFGLAVLLYGVSLVQALFLWRQGFRRDSFINYCILLLGFGFHTLAMGLRGFSFNRCPIHNLFEASMFIGWTMVAAYMLVGCWRPLQFLGAFVSPLVFSLGVFALMPPLDVPEAPTEIGWFSLHASLIFLSYGSLGLGAAAGMMFLTQEHDLKFHKFRALYSLLPPIQRLETLVSQLLLAGYVLLTAGLIVGAFWLKQKRGVWYVPDPKIHWSALIWLYIIALLIWHWRYALRGRKFAWAVVGGFIFIALTFWGFNIFSPLHHP